MFLVALVQAGVREIFNFFRAALRTAHLAICPAVCNHELLAVLKIAEVLDGLLKCFWAFHASKLARNHLSVKYIITQKRDSQPSTMPNPKNQPEPTYSIVNLIGPGVAECARPVMVRGKTPRPQHAIQAGKIVRQLFRQA